MGYPNATMRGTTLARSAQRIPHAMRTTASFTATAPVRSISKDLVIRYVLVPLVMAIGLYGLINYAVTGEGGTTDKFGPTSIETPALP